ncbi:MAG TPA: hypothetical protein VFT22_45065 [Kofleriaceae bacterium]|nr:hypothetical protein [Kofleriaceae bacterium]
MIAALASAPARPALGMIDLLLRDREAMLARIRSGTELAAILRTMIATIAVTMAIVGATLGSYRGGVQIAYAAIKLPVVLLGTAALSAPALSAVGAALGRRSRLAADLALVMAALAFGSLLLVACTPLVMLGRSVDLAYHRMILAVVAMFAIAGGAALRMICRGVALEAAPGWRTAVAGMCVVFSLVGGQLSWALRPYLVRPRTPDVPFVRDVEGSLFDSVTGAMQSARGIYERDAAPLGERAP